MKIGMIFKTFNYQKHYTHLIENLIFNSKGLQNLPKSTNTAAQYVPNVIVNIPRVRQTDRDGTGSQLARIFHAILIVPFALL